MTEFDGQAHRAMPAPKELSDAQLAADDQDVANALHGLAVIVSTVDDFDGLLTQIAEFAVRAIPGADGAGVTLVRNPNTHPAVLTWAVTDPFVRKIDHLQYEVCREGPCLTAMQTGRAVLSGSIGSDARWPRLGGRAARLQVHSSLSLPLTSRGTVVGALNVYAHARDTFDEYALELATRFATPAGVSVGNIQLLQAASQRAAQLQAALTNRAVIDQAIGIVRSRSGGSTQEAFNSLKRISQTEQVKLAVVAQQLVDEAVRRAHRTGQAR